MSAVWAGIKAEGRANETQDTIAAHPSPPCDPPSGADLESSQPNCRKNGAFRIQLDARSRPTTPIFGSSGSSGIVGIRRHRYGASGTSVVPEARNSGA